MCRCRYCHLCPLEIEILHTVKACLKKRLRDMADYGIEYLTDDELRERTNIRLAINFIRGVIIRNNLMAAAALRDLEEQEDDIDE